MAVLLAESYERSAVTTTNAANGKINHNSNRARKLSVNLNSRFIHRCATLNIVRARVYGAILRGSTLLITFAACWFLYGISTITIHLFVQADARDRLEQFRSGDF
ncbi:hypothetical protein [Paraburkholderia diazotrophica]|uniref:hypothetical protein n=1 Tax=Paraburkholderia diazotrophica TaxID=667676 RepID=UPI0015A5F134|nr:hypothetical protein [Paraburkholderia diazotrophica]